MTDRMAPLMVGQSVEWLVWLNLTVRSHGALHVFLPTCDMGIDAIVRRPATDAMLSVQVKGRTTTKNGILQFQVPEEEVRDDSAKIIVALADLDNVSLQSHALLIDVPVFRELAAPAHNYGAHSIYAVSTEFPPRTTSRWHPHCTPLEQLGERICPSPAQPSTITSTLTKQPSRRGTGYRGEMEFVRRAADCDVLNVFHAMPDTEMDEYLVRHDGNGHIIGIQVKCMHVSAERMQGEVLFELDSLQASERTYAVLFAESQTTGQFIDECLVIPAAELLHLGTVSHGMLELVYTPASHRASRFDPYRLPLQQLGNTLERLLT